MVEVRCAKCGKLLGRVDGDYEIKCIRCGGMNIKTSSNQEKIITRYYCSMNSFSKIETFEENPDFFIEEMKQSAVDYCSKNGIEYENIDVSGTYIPGDTVCKGVITITIK